MDTTAKAPLTGKQITAMIVSWMFVAITAYFSAAHIFSLGRTNGLAMAEAVALVPMIDGFGVLGRILRSLNSKRARRFGTWMTVAACTVSLAANWAHGHTLGQRLFGLLTVVGFVAAEATVHMVKVDVEEQAAKHQGPAAPQITAADVQAAVAAAVGAALAQAAIDTQAALDAAVTAERARGDRRVARARKAAERTAQQATEDSAPVSPAGPSGLIVPTAHELRETVYGRR